MDDKSVQHDESIRAALDAETTPLLVRRAEAVVLLSAGGILAGMLVDAFLGRSGPQFLFSIRVAAVLTYGFALYVLEHFGRRGDWSQVRRAAVVSAAIMAI